MFWPIGAPRIYAVGVRQPSADAVDSTESISEGEKRLDRDLKLPERRFLESESVTPSEESADALESTEQSGDARANDTSKENGRKLDRSRQNGRHSLVQDEPSTTSRQPREIECGTSSETAIIDLRISRSGHIFATLTLSSLTIWQTKPLAVLASITRTTRSLEIHGQNTELLLRPDCALIGVQTRLGHVFTYSVAADPDARVYKYRHLDAVNGHAGRQSVRDSRGLDFAGGTADEGGLREISVEFQWKGYVGIGRSLALDEELITAVGDPATLRSSLWNVEDPPQMEALNEMAWMEQDTRIIDLVYDRQMKLYTWVTSDGRSYAVQRTLVANEEMQPPIKQSQGYCFHNPEKEKLGARKAAINARFSLMAVGCANGSIHVYSARDYHGNIPLSHIVRPNVTSFTSGDITFLSYSPDGYCLFAGYERGWMMWSAFGKAGADSFSADTTVAKRNDEPWLCGAHGGGWISGGSEILLFNKDDDRLWVLEVARSAFTGCFTSANIGRSLLQTSSGFMINRAFESSDLTAIPADASLWTQVQVPAGYLADQWPLRMTVISPDGRYVAVAGRRGLAHYSVASGRWKTFTDTAAESAFFVRGGMCWHQHILIAAVESGGQSELRLYSREQSLDDEVCHDIETLSSPVVQMTTSGEDSVLVYTYENILYHYVITATQESVKLVLVGHIGFHGIIRAPARVRAISWILPEEQLRDGDPSRDVAVASVLFLVDGKMVLLQPLTGEDGELKYDMRVVAHNVEYFLMQREQASSQGFDEENEGISDSMANGDVKGAARHGLQDSLWVFNGQEILVWPDVQDVLRSAAAEHAPETPAPVKIPVDFYPLVPLLDKGVILGCEVDLVQRRDITFSIFRLAVRTHLFLPQLLRHHLIHRNTPAALYLSHYYRRLLYFPHALEVLLHDVLDEEVDTAPDLDHALLPSVLSFLSSYPEYLDILVQCTRKTEVRSWRTLFAYLPPPQDLFEESLQKGRLKTAGGYLLVLHTFQELSSSSEQSVRLLSRAKEEQDWELCKELARFLMALDKSGATLKEALELVELRSAISESGPGKGGSLFETATPKSDMKRWANVVGDGARQSIMIPGRMISPANSGHVSLSRTISEDEIPPDAPIGTTDDVQGYFEAVE